MSSTTVFVTGLPTSASQEDVADFFNRIGSVAEVQMPAADSTAPVAVVFDRSEDAAAALSISGSDFQEGVPIQIAASAAPATAPAMGEEEAGEEKAHDAAAPAGDSEANHGADGAEKAGRGVAPRKNRDSRSDITNKVIVSHLAPFTHRQDVLDAFAHCGELDDFAMVPPRHIAFLGFTTAEGFEKALAMNGATIKNARISVERRAPRPEGEGRPASASVPGSGPRTVPNRIVVRNVSSAVTEASVRAFFESDCGVPTDIYLKPQSGIVFVAFDSEEATTKAVAKSGQELDGVAVQVELREVLVCRRCGKDGHKKAECRQPYCTDCRVVGHANSECPRRRGSGRSRRGGGGGGGGSGVSRRRRRSSSSSDRDRRRRRHRSDSEDRYRRRRDSRSRSRSRSPPRRRRDSRSRSRSPPRRRR